MRLKETVLKKISWYQGRFSILLLTLAVTPYTLPHTSILDLPLRLHVSPPTQLPSEPQLATTEANLSPVFWEQFAQCSVVFMNHVSLSEVIECFSWLSIQKFSSTSGQFLSRLLDKMIYQ